MKIENVNRALQKAGINQNDTIMIHGDAIVAAQFLAVDKEKRLESLLKEIINYITKEGTLIIPTFTYSLTNNEIYDVLNSKSKIGKFSECFRKLPNVKRSLHPIFSVAVLGKNENDFVNSDTKDCFGDNTIFDILHRLDGKIMNLGCEFNITYAHYVEQKLSVEYRYFKNFNGFIINESEKKSVKTRYFVGDKKLRYSLKLDKLKQRLILKNKIKISSFGRFASYTVRCQDFFKYAKELIEENHFGLIEEGQSD